MKRYLFNIIFLMSFIILFSGAFMFYYDDFAKAFSRNALFSEDKSFKIKECQRWTDDIREFNLMIGETAEKIPVLMYHRIIDDSDISDVHFNENNNLLETVVLKSEFEKQMQYLHDEGYAVLNLQEFLSFIKNEFEVPEKSVLITFDDGFKDNFTEAYPVLKSYGFTAVDFIVTGLVSEQKTEYDPREFQYFSLHDIKNSCDVFQFQTHTYNFHQRTEDGKAFLVSKSKEEIKSDLKKSLQNLNNAKIAIAYPYGSYDKEAIEAVKDIGFNVAFTVQGIKAKPSKDIYEVPRIAITSDDSIGDFRQKLEGEH
ncbi:polysaccharide deacetylase family protein [Pontibacillus yanchengensis]|uniref:NodB homology domain-containing protein n=1 Tax=Pontibacillus yanchengensis Y32 TaxID=1385514 RepID=A0A0A2TZA5_9BACI|nr:polysaccharide deacetylase family protein [Pontibacillus yanchengensis]KGP74605.1 hypothetical protein N782_00725 [Pontibacillus yanchengensis Y32]